MKFNLDDDGNPGNTLQISNCEEALNVPEKKRLKFWSHEHVGCHLQTAWNSNAGARGREIGSGYEGRKQNEDQHERAIHSALKTLCATMLHRPELIDVRAFLKRKTMTSVPQPTNKSTCPFRGPYCFNIRNWMNWLRTSGKCSHSSVDFCRTTYLKIRKIVQRGQPWADWMDRVNRLIIQRCTEARGVLEHWK